MRATINNASDVEQTALPERELIAESSVGLWFVMLSPLLGILLGLLGLIVFAD